MIFREFADCVVRRLIPEKEHTGEANGAAVAGDASPWEKKDVVDDVSTKERALTWQLPCSMREEKEEGRKERWEKFDRHGNGHISLSE